MASYRAKPQDGPVWITGASMGIGAETAYALANRGYTVYASARSADKLGELAQDPRAQGRVLPLPLDVTDRDACADAMARISTDAGAPSVVLLNAGTFLPIRGHGLAFESFDTTMAVNFDGVVNAMIPAIDAMLEAGRGQLGIVSSVAGYGGLKKSASYGASKAALINMAESLKFDLDRRNIRIQIITPGFIDTPLTEKNDFPMPFLMPADKAAERIVQGLERGGFEITFPRRFTWGLKAVNLLPYSLYFPIMDRMTGGSREKR